MTHTVKSGETLAEAYASADVFVFPSRTDTYGVVLLEALASGVPVAAYPVTGPLDVFRRANAYSKGLVTKDPCCYPSGKGQQLMAELVFKAGLKPLR